MAQQHLETNGDKTLSARAATQTELLTQSAVKIPMWRRFIRERASPG